MEKGELHSVCQGFPGAAQGGGCGGSALQAENQPLQDEGNIAHPGALPRSDPKATPTLLTSLFMLYRAVVYTKEAISIFLVKNKYFRFLCGPRQKVSTDNLVHLYQDSLPS